MCGNPFAFARSNNCHLVCLFERLLEIPGLLFLFTSALISCSDFQVPRPTTTTTHKHKPSVNRTGIYYEARVPLWQKTGHIDIPVSISTYRRRDLVVPLPQPHHEGGLNRRQGKSSCGEPMLYDEPWSQVTSLSFDATDYRE